MKEYLTIAGAVALALTGSRAGSTKGHIAFVLKHVENGLAHGFSYILMTRKKSCKDNGPTVIDGNAEYQGPLK